MVEYTRGRKRVLVVDESMATRTLVQLLLENEGYCVDTALDSADALAKAELHTPDLILLDMPMPPAAARAEPGRRTEQRVIQIIALAAHGRMGGEHLSVEADCLGYVAKPIDPVELLTKVRRCLQIEPELPPGDEPGAT